MRRLLIPFASCALVFLVLSTPNGARAAEPILLQLDASKAPTQDVAFVHEVIPVQAGQMALYYPKWIPGEHSPSGPITNLVALQISANGQRIAWKRDPFDVYRFAFTVPEGVHSLRVDFAFVGVGQDIIGHTRFASSNILVITWNSQLLYPTDGTIQNTIFRPSIVLPGSNWKYATALTGGRRQENTVTFDDVSLEHLIDSPLFSGTNFRRWDLWTDGEAHAYLNVFADIPEELAVRTDVIEHYRKLLREMIALYGARHWRNYNFLLTVSDQLPGEGIEHHESSDDGSGGDYLVNPESLDQGADLLSHEFNHSWDGKYRMPVGLYQDNLQKPYDDSLLWVYEGMTQYYGDVMSFRDGLREAKNWPDHLAKIYANLDDTPGRTWRPLDDTAASAMVLYGSPRGYGNERRSVDFYVEGELMWLRADAIIRVGTGNKKSLDTFARAFFGQETTGPIVRTYDRDDIIKGLNAAYPFDWAGFFHLWIDDIAVHPPDPFTLDGWRFTYTSVPTHDVTKENFWYSLGIKPESDGTISDVLWGSPAWKAQLGIHTKIIAVNGREYSSDLLNDALLSAQRSHQPLRLLVDQTASFRDVTIPYYDGPRYPHLEHISGAVNYLTDVIAPKSK